MIHLSYNGELYSYDNKTTTTVSAVTNIPVVIHPYADIEGAKLYYKQDDVEGIVDISDNTANVPGAYLVTGDLQVALKLASGTMSNTFTIGVTVISSSGDIMDDDIQFTMDNKKRLILVPGYQTLLAIQFDNQSEIVTFKLPRYQESVDLSTKTPYVNYRRPQVKDLGKAICTIDKVDEDTIYFSWLVYASVTQYEGIIQFQVEFYGNDGYRWQSQIGELPILTSLYNTGLEPYTPNIMEQYLQQFQSIKSDTEAYAVGTRNGIPVNTTDPTYHNNAKYYAEQGGVSNSLKQALLQLASNVAYIDQNGQDYYDDLYNALYPLTSITAVYVQSGTVFTTDSLDSLKSDLTVTAVYDESTEIVPSTDYTLSGNLTTGTSTITVSYRGQTTTFNVNVSAVPGVFSVENTLVGCTNSNDATTATENTSYSGTITASSGYTLIGATVSVTMGGMDITATTYDNGTISIAAVTGNVEISVTAVAVVLSSISAVYTQSGTVYDTDSLDSLKSMLVVTATYSDSTSQTVTDYMLTGTLTEGTSVITVSYGGKTTTFNVTVTHNPYWLVLSIADDFVEGTGTGGSWNDTYGGYFIKNTNRCACSVFLNHVMELGYKYTFECNISNNKQFGVPYYKAAALTAVQNHQSIGGSADYFIADPGWKTHGYVFTPPEDCIAQIQFNATQAALLSAGITELRIIKEVVS